MTKQLTIEDLQRQAAADKAEILSILRASAAEARAANAEARAANAAAAEANKRAAQYRAESDKYRAEADKYRAEADKYRAEAEAQRIKDNAEFKARVAQADKEIAENRKGIAENWKKIGELTNTIGKELEEDVVDHLRDSTEFCDMPIGKVRDDLSEDDPQCQYDAAIINDDNIIVVEIKRKLTVEVVQKFIRRQLPLFAEAFPSIAGDKKILGAMVFQRANGGTAVRKALKAGIHLYHATSPKTLTPIKTEQDLPPN